jgi:hypothetical protein
MDIARYQTRAKLIKRIVLIGCHLFAGMLWIDAAAAAAPPSTGHGGPAKLTRAMLRSAWPGDAGPRRPVDTGTDGRTG